MGNVNSLSNKVDELEALVRNQRQYRKCSLMCFVETWLNNKTPDSCVDIPGFSMVRADRDAKVSRKSKGGGLILFVKNRWCNPGHYHSKGEHLQSGYRESSHTLSPLLFIFHHVRRQQQRVMSFMKLLRKFRLNIQRHLLQ